MLRTLLVLATAVIGSSSLLADYEAKVTLYQGDPQGSREAGTVKLVAAPTLVIRPGEDASVFVGGQVKAGQHMKPVGREVEIIPTEVDGGGLRVRVVLKIHTLAGRGATAQVTTRSEEATATIQASGTMRVEIGKDPKDRQWVDVTVRLTE